MGLNHLGSKKNLKIKNQLEISDLVIENILE